MLIAVDSCCNTKSNGFPFPPLIAKKRLVEGSLTNVFPPIVEVIIINQSISPLCEVSLGKLQVATCRAHPIYAKGYDGDEWRRSRMHGATAMKMQTKRHLLSSRIPSLLPRVHLPFSKINPRHLFTHCFSREMGRIIIPKGRPKKYHMLAHRGRGMDVQPNTRKHACTASMASVHSVAAWRCYSFA